MAVRSPAQAQQRSRPPKWPYDQRPSLGHPSLKWGDHPILENAPEIGRHPKGFSKPTGSPDSQYRQGIANNREETRAIAYVQDTRVLEGDASDLEESEEWQCPRRYH